ncbi:ATP-binding cassette transporter snq2 [Friedmanniomyces endolithicus]|nr:ATP-binding cassette transporter snq2 [Friedmanniomyces endolithicus]
MLPVFWRYWMYYVNPSTYWIGGVLAATLHNIPVRCTSEEAGHFNAPPGQTCEQYAGAFAQAAGGLLLNPGATADCQYCQYSSGDQYLASLNIQASDKWRDFGIFLIFVFSNWFLVYFFIYTVRVKGWSFGFGALFGALEKVAKAVKRPFAKMFAKKEEQE